eukprot:1496484-Prymnesium_polylepis.1
MVPLVSLRRPYGCVSGVQSADACRGVARRVSAPGKEDERERRAPVEPMKQIQRLAAVVLTCVALCELVVGRRCALVARDGDAGRLVDEEEVVVLEDHVDGCTRRGLASHRRVRQPPRPAAQQRQHRLHVLTCSLPRASHGGHAHGACEWRSFKP